MLEQPLSSAETIELEAPYRGSPAPLLIPVLLWCAGLIWQRFLPLPLPIWLIAVFPLLLAAIFVPRLRTVCLLLLCVFCGGLRLAMHHDANEPLRLVLGNRTHIQQYAEFRVGDQFSGSTLRYSADLLKLAGKPLKGKIILTSADSLSSGARYTGILELSPLNADPILDFYPNRFAAFGRVLLHLQRLPGDKRFTASGMRQILLHRLDRIAGEDAGMAKALLLSDVGAKKDYQDKLQRGGMVHLIVVSGLHVWFIYGLAMLILRMFLPRRVAEVLFLILICGFAALNLWAPAITRAILMIALFILSRWLMRHVSNVQILALCMLIITLIAPQQLFAVGLQLSFVSVGLLLLAVPKVLIWNDRRKHKRWWHYRIERIVNYILLTGVVSLGIMPLTLFYFGNGSLNGILGNLLGIPLVGLMIPLALLLLILPAQGFVTAAFVTSYRFFAWLFVQWMEFSAALPFHFSGMYPDLWQCLGMAVILLTLFYWLRRLRWPRWRHLVLPAALSLILIFALPALLSRKTGVWIFNAGTADCALIRLPGGMNLMIDTGAGNVLWEKERDAANALSQDTWMRKRLLPWLRKQGVSKLDYLILTHSHADHSGGVPALLARLPVRHIVISDETEAGSLWQQWQDAKVLGNTRIVVIRDTVSIALGASRLKFLHPDADAAFEGENSQSLVCRLDHKGKRYLFTGDIEAPAEQYLLQRYPRELRAEYLKVAHHGSKSSSSAPFLRAVSPEEAWISTAKRNRYAFPHQQTMQNLGQYAGRVRITHTGTIHIPFD